MSSACSKWVLNHYKGPCLFYEWSETQVEVAALWSVGFSMYLYIHNFNLFSLLVQLDILYLSFKGTAPLCLLLSEITFSFFQKLNNILQEVQLATVWAPCDEACGRLPSYLPPDNSSLIETLLSVILSIFYPKESGLIAYWGLWQEALQLVTVMSWRDTRTKCKKTA